MRTINQVSKAFGLIVATIFLASGIWCQAQRGVGTTFATDRQSQTAATSLFAPAMSVVQPPVRATNFAYNVGLVLDTRPMSGVTYRIHYGTNTAFLTNTVTTTNTFCTISNLAFKPTWYFQAQSVFGTNVSEGSHILRIQPPLESGFVLSAVFPLYSSTNGVNWITNKIVTLVQTNPPGNTFFRSHLRQLDYQWTNNQIRLKPFPI